MSSVGEGEMREDIDPNNDSNDAANNTDDDDEEEAEEEVNDTAVAVAKPLSISALMALLLSPIMEY